LERKEKYQSHQGGARPEKPMKEGGNGGVTHKRHEKHRVEPGMGYDSATGGAQQRSENKTTTERKGRVVAQKKTS